jgi:hypothetical protein
MFVPFGFPGDGRVVATAATRARVPVLKNYPVGPSRKQESNNSVLLFWPLERHENGSDCTKSAYADDHQKAQARPRGIFS